MENASAKLGLISAEKVSYYLEKYDFIFFLGILTEIQEFLSLS